MESKQGQNLTDQIHNMVAIEMYCHPGFGTRIFAKLRNLKLSSWSIKVFVVITWNMFLFTFKVWKRLKLLMDFLVLISLYHCGSINHLGSWKNDERFCMASFWIEKNQLLHNFWFFCFQKPIVPVHVMHTWYWPFSVWRWIINELERKKSIVRCERSKWS